MAGLATLAQKIAASCALSIGLAACDDAMSELTKPPAPVVVVKAQLSDYAPTIRLSGEVRARRETDLAFRVGGKIKERLVETGDHVVASQVVARLDPEERRLDADVAATAVAEALAQLEEARSSLARQKTLFEKGFAAQAVYDQASEAVGVAEGALKAAQAQHATVLEALSFTELQAPANGVIVARSAEAGQIVQAAQAIYTLAEDGPFDAVFHAQEVALLDAPDSLEADITLISDEAVVAKGRLREVSPTVDPNTGTVRVILSIEHPLEQMALGAAVSAKASLRKHPSVILPASALTTDKGRPAVRVIAPETHIVSSRPVEVSVYDTSHIVLTGGVEAGELVVIQGPRTLLPGRPVRIIAEVTE